MQELACNRCSVCAWKIAPCANTRYYIYDAITGEIYIEKAYIAQICVYLIKNEMELVDEEEFNKRQVNNPLNLVPAILEKE